MMQERGGSLDLTDIGVPRVLGVRSPVGSQVYQYSKNHIYHTANRLGLTST